MTTLRNRLISWVTGEKTGGLLLLIAAGVALIWANLPGGESYHALAQTTVGPASLGLNMTLAEWASGGLLAIFFFVVGAELKQEMVTGSLRNIRQAAVPVLAAVGGMAVPALIYTAVVTGLGEPAARHGWAIPTATDIAFAVAVLAIFGRGLPAALRMFLLTLAVVDDLLAITVIAVFYSDGVSWLPLVAALGVVLVFGWVARQKWARWWILLPLGILAWVLMHYSGVHTTVAGVALGFTLPARPIHGEFTARTVRYGEAVGPLSSGVALPIFAFFAAGVTVVGGAETSSVLVQPVVLAIVLGLVAGKVIGVLGTTALLVRFTGLELAEGIKVPDLLPVAFLTGIGFTVALLIAELSFADPTLAAGAKIGVLLASLIAAILGAVSLSRSARRHATNS